MRTIVAALVAVSLSLAFHACSGGRGPSSSCRTGCPCGRTCISCSDRCHMAQEIEDEPGDGGADAVADR